MSYTQQVGRVQIASNYPSQPTREELKEVVYRYIDHRVQLIEAREMIKEGVKLKEEGAKLKEEGANQKANGQKRLAEAKIQRQALEAKKKAYLVKFFCLVVGKKPPEPTQVDEINSIFSSYAFDGAFGIEGKLTLISVEPFSKYLDQNPESRIELLNFTGYKKIQDISSVMKTLSDRLQQPGCSVKKIAFDAGLQEEVTTAVANMGGTTVKVLFPKAKTSQ